MITDFITVLQVIQFTSEMLLLLSVSAVSMHVISTVKARPANFIINIKITDLQYHVCVHLADVCFRVNRSMSFTNAV